MISRNSKALAILAVVAALAGAENTSAAEGPIDPAAIEAVKAMGAYLRSLPSFELAAELSYDEVVGETAAIQRNESAIVAARSPDKLYVAMIGAERKREIFYNGTQVTIFGSKLGYYAQFDAPNTIRAAIEAATLHYDVEIPLADLFFWGSEQADVEAIKGAAYVGPAQIGRRTCDQYAFTQESADWQLWIAQGDRKMPCKLVITDTASEARPQYSAIIEIVPEKNLTDDVFEFVPPHTAHRIAIVPVANQ